ncbi:MAG: alkaline phosphatase D family protein [Proteobacteria bacterium]|nr:alkaline phosphatase D family protein [Pseudomonadota bacterium]
MDQLSRRDFIQTAFALGATAAVAAVSGKPSTTTWRERRDLFPEGVASAEPTFDSILLWTRYPPPSAPGAHSKVTLKVELAKDPHFQNVVSTSTTTALGASDWTCRVLVGGLEPSHEYWYRFTDSAGNGSRVGRTLTAPAEDDPRPVKFAFVSCQNANQGAQHAYRRMIFEDEKAAAAERLGFVLHLGDFIYEIVWYPEDRPQGMYDRRLRDIVRYEHGEKISDFHIPTTLDDYRAVYRAYLRDPDLQDARARWPFINMWDNHEFSWLGWQAIQDFEGKSRPAQTRKVAANQAWFEYQPARVTRPGVGVIESFEPPKLRDAPIDKFDEDGFGQEPNNIAAVESLTGYRRVRFGRNVDLIITDQHSYRSHEPTARPEATALDDSDFPQLLPEEVLQVLDAGREYNSRKPPPFIELGSRQVANFCKNDPPQTIFGRKQKEWFLEQLRTSRATWKIWGNTEGTLDGRADPQNLPPGITKPWAGAGYAVFGGGGDHATAYLERAEIYDFVRQHGITGFATVAGDRHSFWAGLASKALPPQPFDPVGIVFVTGSISAPGLVEALEHKFPAVHPLRPLYLADSPVKSGPGKPKPAVNMLLKHGVKSCLEYARSADIAQARKLSNPHLAPHLSFIDMGGHGYATVRATSQTFETEFVCIPRPLERIERADGGPLLYRVAHRAQLWTKDGHPRLEQTVLEGNPEFSL